MAAIRQQQNQLTNPVNIVAPFPMTTDTQAPSTSGSSGSSSSRIAQRLAVSGLYSQGQVISSSSAMRLNGQPIIYPTPIEQTDMSVAPPAYPSFNVPSTPTARERHLQHSPLPHFYYRQSSSPQSSVLSSESRHTYRTESEKDLDEEDCEDEGNISVSLFTVFFKNLIDIIYCFLKYSHKIRESRVLKHFIGKNEYKNGFKNFTVDLFFTSIARARSHNFVFNNLQKVA